MRPDDAVPPDPAQFSDRELVERMRREELVALREFFERFRPLLVREARRLGVQPALRDETVLECLDDAAIRLLRHTTALPRSLAAYLVATLRHDVLNAARAAGRYVARNERAAGVTNGEALRDDSVVLETCSEGSVRASAGPEWEVVPLAPAIEQLAHALDKDLSEEERRILGWLGQWVPQTRIADWLGISYGALRVRLTRLRDRLREATLQYVAELRPGERAVLQEFLRRTALTQRAADRCHDPDARRSTRSTAASTVRRPTARGTKFDREEDGR